MLKFKINGKHITKDFNGRHYTSSAGIIRAIRGTTVHDPYPYFSGGRNHANGVQTFKRDGTDYVRVYNLNKVRVKIKKFAKPKQWTKKKLRDNGYAETDVKYDYFELVHPTHWTATYYDIPIVVLDLMRKKVIQHRHRFELVSI